MTHKPRQRPRDAAAFGLGLLCLIVAGGALAQVCFGLAAVVIHVAVPTILILLAILALFGLRR
ncbi:MAG: hypothetical protein LBK54_00070 [Propionibacteriaceae bacterium]|jgi:hypothetical protein|nr:hypothetical protein [Propionibacteriaceae bacterium]